MCVGGRAGAGPGGGGDAHGVGGQNHPLGRQLPRARRSHPARVHGVGTPRRVYLTQSVFKVVLQKSTPPQLRQGTLYYQYKGYVDGFVAELASARRLYKHFVWDKSVGHTIHWGMIR